MNDLANEISKVYASLKFDNLPPEVVETTEKFILDTLGCGLAGAKAPGMKEVYDMFAFWGGRNEATVLGYGGKLPCPAAAFVNSALCHALDFDDTLDDAAMHCYVSALPAALATAEARDAGGKDLILAVVLGVDLTCRLGLAIKTPLSWIRTATCGSFGAAVAAAKVLSLDEEGIRNALGVVYSQTAGNAQCLLDGGLSKRMQPAFSARAGVVSAFLAERGITGAREIFEGKYGFFNLYERGAYDRQACLENLGRDFCGTKLSIKPYPCCRMTHAAIDAALAVREKYRFQLGDVDRVELFIAGMSKEMVGGPFEIRKNPQVDAQFSVPYTVAVALKKGKPVIEDFAESTVMMPEWKEITKKITVTADREIDARDIHRATIKVYLRNGEVLTHRVEAIKGHPRNPLSWEEVIDKFKNCAGLGVRKFSEPELDRLIELVVNLEKVKIKDLCSLLE
jgi:2-methylcitrate dehydratase PrpD